MTLYQRHCLQLRRTEWLKALKLRTFNVLSQRLLGGIWQATKDPQTGKNGIFTDNHIHDYVSRKHVGCCVPRVKSYKTDLSTIQ
jgi:hypothetical protein